MTMAMADRDVDAITGTLSSPVSWYGGKGLTVARLLPLLPYGPGIEVYVEPYCGGASLFFAKAPHPVEVLNDLDERIVNLFRVMQDRGQVDELRHKLLHTPYARSEYARAIRILESGEGSCADLAWAFFVVQNQIVSGIPTGQTPGRWGRAFASSDGIAMNVNRWIKRLVMLPAWHKRLMMAQIDCRDALEVIAYWDSPKTLFYLDPPYHPETRDSGSYVYRHEPGHEHHERLAALLMELKGGAVLSGYQHPVYEPLERAGWMRMDFSISVFAAVRGRGTRIRGDGTARDAVPRTECVWLSPVVQRWRSVVRQASIFDCYREE
jgi:DNA adenine methylase